jgi:hypothetical protein
VPVAPRFSTRRHWWAEGTRLAKVWKIGFRFGVARKGGGTEAERWWAEAAGAPLEPPANDKTGGGRAAGTMEAET